MEGSIYPGIRIQMLPTLSMRFPKIRLRYLVPVVLAILFLTAGIPSILQPLVYEKTPPRFMTRFHLDPTLYRESTRNASESGLSGMQDLIDASGPLSLSIRVRDPESAMRDLRQYLNAVDNLDNLVIEFEMSESELGTYLEEHQENAEILGDLLTETTRFDELQHMELQFSDAKDAGQLTTVILEKEAIRNRISEMYEKYRANGADIETKAAKYALDPTSTRQSTSDFYEIVKEVDAQQTRSIAELRQLDKGKVFVSLFVEPAALNYGDVLRVWGISSVQGNTDRSVRVYFDGLQSGTALLGGDGGYEYFSTIERITTGIHNVYAQDGGTRSAVESFTVQEMGSKITLVAKQLGAGVVVCTGVLTTAQGRKVRGAPVEITWDGEHIVNTETGESGTYETKVTLPAGKHALKARFKGTGFPIGASESKVVSVDVSGGIWGGTPLAVIIAGGIMLASGAGAVLYLRRKGVHYKSGLEGEEPVSDLVAEPTGPGLRSSGKRTTSLIELFLRLIGLTGLREAAFAVYRRFTMRVEGLLGLARIRSLTPRELAVRSAGLPFHAALQDFIPRYELLRYGPDPDSGREAFESVIGPLDIATRKGENIRDLTRGESGEQEGGILTGNEIDQNPPGERKTPSDESASGHEGSQSGVIEWR